MHNITLSIIEAKAMHTILVSNKRSGFTEVSKRANL